MHQDQDVGVIPFSPLAHGVLARKPAKESEETIRYQIDALAKERYAQEDNQIVIERGAEALPAPFDRLLVWKCIRNGAVREVPSCP